MEDDAETAGLDLTEQDYKCAPVLEELGRLREGVGSTGWQRQSGQTLLILLCNQVSTLLVQVEDLREDLTSMRTQSTSPAPLDGSGTTPDED
jgi:hypothetical protein